MSVAIFNLWGHRNTGPVKVSDDEVAAILKLLEESNGELSNKMPLRKMVSNGVMKVKPRLLGRELEYSHYSLYVFSMVDQAFLWLEHRSDISAEITDALLSLKLPIARISFEEEDFLTKANHPVRKFLDQLMSFAFGSVSLEKDEVARKLIKYIKGIESLYEFDEKQALALDGLLNHEKKRVDMAANRITKTLKGKLRSEQAEKATEQALAELLEVFRVPETMKRLLRLWKNHLLIMHLDESITRQDWAYEVDQFADILALFNRSVKVKPGQELDWPRIHQQKTDIRAVMEKVDYPHSGREPLLGAFESFYKQIERGQPISMMKISLKERFKCPADFDMGFIVPKEMEHLKRLEVGTWLDFNNSQQETVRAQLIVKIPESSSMVFMRREGPKVFEKSFSDVALGIETNTVHLVDHDRLFSRALEVAVKRAGGICHRVNVMADQAS